MTYTH